MHTWAVCELALVPGVIYFRRYPRDGFKLARRSAVYTWQEWVFPTEALHV